MKKILIVGSTGTLGSSFYKILKKNKRYSVIGISRGKNNYSVDITNRKHFLSTLEEINPDIIFNCSGIVDINYCEENPYKAWNMHVNSTLYLHKYLYRSDKKYIHISTDQFYDGGGGKNSETLPFFHR